MTSGYVVVDGVAAPLDAPVIAATDMGFLHGDSLFTTMAVHAGHLVLWERHALRLERSLAEFGYPEGPGRETLLSDCLQAIRIQPFPPTALRLTLSRGRATNPGIDGLSEALVRVVLPLFRTPRSIDEIAAGARAEAVSLPWNPAAIARFRHKTGNLLWAKMLRGMKAHPESVEQILLSPRNEILEGTVSSVFAVESDGTLVTAPVTAGILPGVMRAEVLSWARNTGRRVREESPRISRAASYREFFLTSTTLPVLPIHTLDLSEGPVHYPRDFPVSLEFLSYYRRTILASASL